MVLSRLLSVCWIGWLLAGPPGALAQTAPPTDAALLAAHRTVAVLPFEATVQQVRMRELVYGDGVNAAVVTGRPVQLPQDAARQQEQLRVAYEMQALTLSELLDRQPRHGYRVRWQPVEETNRRLQAAGITYATLAGQPMDRLRQVLGVDALLTGQVLMYQPVPKTLGLALRVLSSEPLLGPSSVPPSQTEASLALYDCGTSRLVWQADYGRSGANALVPARLAPRLVKAALPTLPYCQR